MDLAHAPAIDLEPRVEVVQSPTQWCDFAAVTTVFDALHVRPDAAELAAQLDPRRRLFFRHAEAIVLLARVAGVAVGRVVGFVDHRVQEPVAFFGCFECVDRPQVAKALLDVVGTWAASRGARRLRGPMPPGGNDEIGVLVAGFDDAPHDGMPYNPPYYGGLLAACGFEKTTDFQGFEIGTSLELPAALAACAAELDGEPRIRVRPFNLAYATRDVDLAHRIYEDAFRDHWGHVATDRPEFHQDAEPLLECFDPELFPFVTVDGEAAGFAMALPDARGRARLDTVGVCERFRSLRVGPLLYRELMQRCRRAGIDRVELSPTHEHNRATQRLAGELGLLPVKVFRVYERRVT